jgi:hypothetical protein
MPEHVHLLVWGLKAKEDASLLLARIKQPVSIQVKKNVEAAKSPLLPRLTVCERPGKFVFRLWQEGPDFDRNLRRIARRDGHSNSERRTSLLRYPLPYQMSRIRFARIAADVFPCSRASNRRGKTLAAFIPRLY